MGLKRAMRSRAATVVDISVFSAEKARGEQTSKDMAVIDSLLTEGYTYSRELCRDSIGGERPIEKNHFRVELIKDVTKEKLYAFLCIELGGRKNLSDVSKDSEEFFELMDAAENASLIKTKKITAR